MKRRIIAIFLALALALTLAACGEEKETTLSGMVVSVDGTVISLVEMDTADMGSRAFEGFDPEGFDGALPEGETFPQWGGGEMPEMPEGMELPEGMTMPENGQMPDFGGESGGKGPGFGNFTEDMETKDVDISGAHISLEIEGGKASGSMEDIKAGTFVTVTVNGKGEATYVMVSAQSGFAGFGGRPAN